MFLVVDTECTGLKIHRGCKPFMVGLCFESGEEWIFQGDVDPQTREVEWSKSDLRKMNQLIREADLLVFHHAKFDRRMLKSIGVDACSKPFWDTSLAAHIRSSSEPLGLKAQAELHLGVSSDDEKDLHKAILKAGFYARKQKWNLGDGPETNYWLPAKVASHAGYPEDHPFHTVCETYLKKDLLRTGGLYLLQKDNPKILKHRNNLEQELELTPVLESLEDRGITINRKRLSAEKSRFAAQSRSAEVRAIRVSGNPDLNIRSQPQLQKLLLDEWNLPVLRRTKKQNPKMDASAITLWLERESSLPEKKQRKYVIDFLQAKLDYSGAATARNYLTSYQIEEIEEVLYSSFNTHGASNTTRSGSSDPNVQNVGKGKEKDGISDFILRSVFGPKPGRVWYDWDFDQLQLRIFAFAAHDQSLIDAFAQGWDFHNFVASRLFKTDTPSKLQRRVAKNVNFALIFGGGATKVDFVSGIPGTYDLYRKQFPCIDRYMEANIKQVRKTGVVYTLGGYPLDVPANAAYAGTNYIIQGTEGEIAKRALINMDAVNRLEEFSWHDAYLTNFVHDELMNDALGSNQHLKSNQKYLLACKEAMESAGRRFGVVTPASCELILDNWAHGEKISL